MPRAFRPSTRPPAPLTPGTPARSSGSSFEIQTIRPTWTTCKIVFGGKNPRGLVINSADTRAYVMEFLSRDVAVVDISGGDPTQYKTLQRMPSAALPGTGTTAEIVQRGKYLFNTSIGPVGTADNSRRPAGLHVGLRLGLVLWVPPRGALADSVTWMFADGPRQTISMESTFPFGQAVIQNGAPKLPDSHQRALNWSAIRDSVQDFERNIRAVSGGGGLIRRGCSRGCRRPGPRLPASPSPRGLRTRGGIPISTRSRPTWPSACARPSPRSSSGIVKKGRALFETAGCASCHGGPNWTNSEIDFAPPPAADQIVDAQLIKFLCRVGTFDAALFTDGVSNEIRANNAANVQARGALGFNPPSLIAVFNSAPYLHSGAAATLDAVLENVTHRTVGRADGLDTLTDAQRPEGAGQVPPVDRPHHGAFRPRAVLRPASAAP